MIPQKVPQKLELQLTENAMRVLERRYLALDAEGNRIETPEDMFRRVAATVASVDDNPREAEEAFYRIMTELDFLPNSPTLMNAGRELGQLSACFVLPVDDSMESIFESVKNTAMIHKSGGGTGFAFSRLRPKGSRVSSTGGGSSGPISFMKVFDTATDVIKQGGKRRGANMGILRVDHPDILEFIYAKEDPNHFNNFNLSVALTDTFMKALENGGKFDLVEPHTRRKTGSLDAREVFDKIVNQAWKNGDPGIIFLDRLNKDNPTPKIGAFEGTNPCGEQPLLPYESCNLGSINLAGMVKKENGAWVLDEAHLDRVVETAVRFLDNVIDVNRFPLPEIEEMTKANRKIGLGVMGFADLLIRLGIPYDSDDAVRTAHEVMGRVKAKAKETSQAIAERNGGFPNFPDSLYAQNGEKPLRNATVTTIAPTGTLSIIAGCSSGIEPIFAISYIRKVMDNDELIETHPYFLELALEHGFYDEELMRRVAEHGGIQDFTEIPEPIRRIFVTAHDITPEWHVRIQAAFQEYTDNAVSKTVNFPHEAKPSDIEEVYRLAYKEGCKGVTIYRDRSRDTQVLNIGSAEAETTPAPADGRPMKIKAPGVDGLPSIAPRPRPPATKGVTERMKTGCGNLYVTVNYDDEGIFEVFAQMGKSGGCAASQIEGIGRLISLALRSRVDLEAIVKQMKGIRCPAPLWGKGGMVLSCSDAISRVLERHLNNGDEHLTIRSGDIVGACPDCGGAVEHLEGCQVCRLCGYTKCG